MNLRFGLAGRTNYDWQSLLQSYRECTKPSSTVLEIGASSKTHTEELSKYCQRLIGIELMPERTPKSFGNVEYITGDWQCLSDFLPKESIDVAVSSHVIEHVIDDRKALKELFKVLKPGGVALINTPNRGRLTRAVIEIFAGPRKFPYWEHQREYVESDIVHLLASSPFKKYEIVPLVFGLHGGPVYCYLAVPPKSFRKYSNFWEIRLFK